jgi:hypothetical protein
MQKILEKIIIKILVFKMPQFIPLIVLNHGAGVDDVLHFFSILKWHVLIQIRKIRILRTTLVE